MMLIALVRRRAAKAGPLLLTSAIDIMFNSRSTNRDLSSKDYLHGWYFKYEQ